MALNGATTPLCAVYRVCPSPIREDSGSLSRKPRTVAIHYHSVSLFVDTASKAKYATLRGRGHSHGRALKSVADRLLNVACAMLKNGTLFNPSLKVQMNRLLAIS